MSDTINGLTLNISGSADGQAIVIHPAGKQFLIVGYGVDVSLKDQGLVWPVMQGLHVQRVHWSAAGWVVDGEPSDYGVNQANRTLWIELDYPQAVLVSMP